LHALFFFSIQIKAELSRILGKPNPVKDIAESLRQNWMKKILEYAETQAGTAKDIVASMKEAITDHTSKKNGECTGNLGIDIHLQ